MNLAVVNALPVPALDGGQLVYLIWEQVSGKRVEERLVGVVNGVASLCFGLLFIFLSAEDVLSS